MRSSPILLLALIFSRTTITSTKLTVGDIVHGPTKEDIELGFSPQVLLTSKLHRRYIDKGLRNLDDVPRLDLRQKLDHSRESRSILERKYQTSPDIHNNGDDLPSIFPRSTKRAAQQGANIIESGSSFKFPGESGVDILTGVGQRLREDQRYAHFETGLASYTFLEENQKIEDAIHTQNREVDPTRRHMLEDDIQKSWVRRERSIAEADAGRQIQKEKGQDIENIGMVNKKMRRRMKQNFPPLHNFFKEYDMQRGAAAKIGVALRTATAKESIRAKKGAARKLIAIAKTAMAKNSATEKAIAKKAAEAKKEAVSKIAAIVRTRAAKKTATERAVMVVAKKIAAKAGAEKIPGAKKASGNRRNTRPQKSTRAKNQGTGAKTTAEIAAAKAEQRLRRADYRNRAKGWRRADIGRR